MSHAHQHLPPAARILDPMAGVGTIHQLQTLGHDTKGIEIEPDWAEQHPDTEQGDARTIPYPTGAFDAIVTSPPYGNRMADGPLLDGTRRRTYATALRRHLTEGNAGALQWGNDYRKTMSQIWTECARVIRPGGTLIVFIKDHIRRGEWQPVTAWTIDTLRAAGMNPGPIAGIPAPGYRHGQNREQRTGTELMIVFTQPE